MRFSGETLRLYAVTDRSWLRPGETLAAAVEEVLRGGATLVQLRDKDLSEEALAAQAETLLPVCRRFGVPLILNDNVAVAAEVGADGVHVGQGDAPLAEARRLLGPGKIIGVSAHNVEEALAAEAGGADYLGCGAVFGSGTKRDASTLTPQGLARICAAVRIPVVAIGGIHAGNIQELNGCGANGVAVISALFAQPDKEQAARRLLALSIQMAVDHPTQGGVLS